LLLAWFAPHESASSLTPPPWKTLGAAADAWWRDRPNTLDPSGSGGFLQHLEPHLPDKLFIHLDALLCQSVNDPSWRGMQAQAVQGAPDRSFLAGCAHVAIVPNIRPICLLPSLHPVSTRITLKIELFALFQHRVAP